MPAQPWTPGRTNFDRPQPPIPKPGSGPSGGKYDDPKALWRVFAIWAAFIVFAAVLVLGMHFTTRRVLLVLFLMPILILRKDVRTAVTQHRDTFGVAFAVLTVASVIVGIMGLAMGDSTSSSSTSYSGRVAVSYAPDTYAPNTAYITPTHAAGEFTLVVAPTAQANLLDQIKVAAVASDTGAVLDFDHYSTPDSVATTNWQIPVTLDLSGNPAGVPEWKVLVQGPRDADGQATTYPAAQIEGFDWMVGG